MRPRFWNSIAFIVLMTSVAGGTASDAMMADSENPISRSSAGTKVPPITGICIDHWISDTGQVDLPCNNQGRPIGAWVGSAETGFTFYPGMGQADGTFMIPDVPLDTSYYFKWNNLSYVFTTAREIDTSIYNQGRPDGDSVGTGTILALDLDGLSPWGVADDIEITSSNAQEIAYNAMNLDIGGHTPEPGDTVLVERLNYLRFIGGHLIDSSRGDQTILHQLVTKFAGTQQVGAVYAAAAKALTSSTLTVRNQQTSVLAGTLTDVPQDQSFSLRWCLSCFHEYRSTIHPLAQFQGDALYISVLPGGLSHGLYAVQSRLVEAYVNPDASDQTFEFTYGNPFPPKWGPAFVEAYAKFAVRYSLPGTLLPYFDHAGIVIWEAVDTFPRDPYDVQLSPPQNLKVNGQDATGELVDVGTMPTISWDLPQVGTATNYDLKIFELFVSGIETRARLAARIQTSDTSVSLFPGVLQTGRRYYFRVSSASNAGPDFHQVPFQIAFPFSYGTAVSGIFDP